MSAQVSLPFQLLDQTISQFCEYMRNILVFTILLFFILTATILSPRILLSFLYWSYSLERQIPKLKILKTSDSTCILKAVQTTDHAKPSIIRPYVPFNFISFSTNHHSPPSSSLQTPILSFPYWLSPNVPY